MWYTLKKGGDKQVLLIGLLYKKMIKFLGEVDVVYLIA